MIEIHETDRKNLEIIQQLTDKPLELSQLGSDSKKNEYWMEKGRIVELKINILVNQDKVLKSIAELKNLQILKIQGISITELPEEIGCFQKLEQLEIFETALRSLPETIGNLQRLKRLKIEVNVLEELPESFGDLQGLEKLEISFT
ncbi:MAG: leucine-rich repeat domain-containing protein, partial [Promethearchaeota archaeon]